MTKIRGDEHEMRSPAETAAAFRPWAYKVAQSCVDESWNLRFDDVAQEGLIHIWRLAEKKPDASAVYYAKGARFRMLNVANGAKPMTGGDSTPGPKYRPFETRMPDDVDDAFGDRVAIINDTPDADTAGPAVRAAVAMLTDVERRAVWLRFWGGKKWGEIGEELGMTKKAVESMWYQRIRPSLREMLAGYARAY